MYNKGKQGRSGIALFYEEKSRKIPVTGEYDVLVAGAGPAGFAAALAAARQGAKTLLVEQQNCVGGMATSGAMSHWVGNCDSKLYHELLSRSVALRDEISTPNLEEKFIDTEQLKGLMLQMLSEAGVSVMLYTFVSDVILDQEKIAGIIVENKSGRQAIYAKTVIDATGDGDVAAKAGVPYYKGREDDEKMQPVTLMFKVGGVDYGKAVFLYGFEDTYETEKGELQALAREHIPYPAGHVLLYPSPLPGVVACNMTNCVEVDGTKEQDLTKAELLCRKQMPQVLQFLREFVPGYERCFLLSSASLIGVRETRHFEGLSKLTEEDILAARYFDDWVVKGAIFNFDVHNITGAGLDKTGLQRKFPQTEGYTIPYGCLLPQRIENLLLCGRNISGTHMAHSNYRAMPICVGIGEAAGVAAAISVKNGVLVKEVTAAEIQQIL